MAMGVVIGIKGRGHCEWGPVRRHKEPVLRYPHAPVLPLIIPIGDTQWGP
jgi:hypothetical protein